MSTRAPHRFPSFTALALLLTGAFAACGAPNKVDAPVSSPGSGGGVAAIEADAAAPVPDPGKSVPPVVRVPGPLCGCSLCEAVVSADTCTTDADCAPETPCHATACVAKAKAKALAPGASCTAIMRCDTADANGCGCQNGRCALFPRPK